MINAIEFNFNDKIHRIIVMGSHYRLICPGCKQSAQMDPDQWNGTVSLDCPSDGCTYHETHSFSKALIEIQNPKLDRD